VTNAKLGKLMASDKKLDSATSKTEPQTKDQTSSSQSSSKAEGGEAVGGASAAYSRGEGQKPVTQAYRDNWNAIFANNKKRR
jgi:hypothetical protein